MRDYLFQPIGAGARRDATTRSFASDDDAIRHALSPAFARGCELWEGYRLVGRFHRAADRALSSRSFRRNASAGAGPPTSLSS